MNSIWAASKLRQGLQGGCADDIAEALCNLIVARGWVRNLIRLEEYAATTEDRFGTAWRGERTRKEVGELLQEAYALAIKIVRDQERALRLASERLVERRTLSKDELGILLGPRPATAQA